MTKPYRPLALVCLGLVLALVLPSFIPGEAPERRRGALVGVDGDTGKPRFRVETPGPGALVVTFSAARVVVAERRGCFSADTPGAEGSTVLVGYDARTGRERWHRAGFVTDGPQTGGWAGLVPGVLPVRSPSTGERLGLDPRTGETVWSRGLETDVVRASTHDLLVTSGAGTDGARLAGLDRTTGETRWSYEVDGGREVRLVGADRDLVVALVVGPSAATFENAAEVTSSLHVISARDGRLQREIPVTASVQEKLATTAITVRGTTIVLDVGQLVAFDARTGTERWRAPGSLDPTLPAAPDVLFVLTGAGTGSPVAMTALDVATGATRWTRDLGRSSYGAANAGRTLVVFRRAAYLGLDVETGRRRWRFDTPRGAAGVTGMSAPDFYLAGGCPISIAD
jgi:outer membrane protein assembly factor BamB